MPRGRGLNHGASAGDLRAWRGALLWAERAEEWREGGREVSVKGKVNADDSPAPPNQLYVVPLAVALQFVCFLATWI